MTRLKSYVSNPVEPGGDEPQPFVALEHIESGTGRLLPGTELPEKSDETAIVHQAGDVRFGKLRPYLAKSLLMETAGIGSGELLVLRPRPEALDSRFLWYLTLSKPFLEWAEVSSYGVKMPRTNWTLLGAWDAWIPPLGEQRQIAAYLDNETGKIDALLAEQRSMASLLNERKWLTFVHGLDRLTTHDIAVKRGLTFITDGPFGSAFSSNDYVDEGVAVVRLGNIGFAEWKGADLAHIPSEMYENFKRHSVHPGDVLIAGLGDERNHAGRACIAPEGLGLAIVKGKCFCARTNQTRLLPEYLALFLSSPIGSNALTLGARGSTRQMINLDILKSTRIPLPSLEAQSRLVNEVAQVWAKVHELQSDIARQERLLGEHRQALITAAVTGQLDLTKSVT